MFVSAIIAAGGRGTRFGGPRPKQLLMLGGRTILERSVDAFARAACVSELVVALPPDLAAAPPSFLGRVAKPVTIVEGGARRQDSVANALRAVSAPAEVVVIHDAARPLVTPALIERTVATAAEHGAAIAALRAHDTVKHAPDGRTIQATLLREQIFLAQTPQAFRTAILREALAHSGDVTDESSLVERAGHTVWLTEGDPRNVKITTPDDLAAAEGLLGESRIDVRIGNGYDLHRLVAGRPLILGGVTIPFEKGLAGHSDGDAVCHAATDALLGACGAGDIGRHFPDSDPALAGANSLDLLRRAATIAGSRGYRLVNLDVVVIAQQPRLSPHIPAMVANLAAAVDVPASRVSIKGKTNEGVDSMGQGDSIAVHAVALVRGSADI